jgi:hypothetical protein
VLVAVSYRAKNASLQPCAIAYLPILAIKTQQQKGVVLAKKCGYQ